MTSEGRSWKPLLLLPCSLRLLLALGEINHHSVRTLNSPVERPTWEELSPATSSQHQHARHVSERPGKWLQPQSNLWMWANILTCSISQRYLCINHIFFKIWFIYFLNIYLFLRENAHKQGKGGEREREGERESKAGSVLTAESLMWGLNPQTTKSWPELKSDA